MSAPEASDWQVFVAAAERLPPERQASAFARLAIEMTSRRLRSEATEYALRAHQLAKRYGTDDEVRQALRKLTAGYHISISTDPDRISAWDAALRHHLRQGMLVLEIGTGSGILAMLAARAGAQVVSCENNAIIAAFAQDVVAENGFSGQVKVVPKPIGSLRLGIDLLRSADLLMLDLFGDSLFDFEPFEAIRAARPLLRNDATVIPMRVALKAALASFKRYNRAVAHRSAQFDLRALAAVQPSRIALNADDPDLLLRSAPEALLAVDLSGALPERAGVVERPLASDGGELNGIAVWIELTLAPEIDLEPRPGGAPRGFYAGANFYPFAEPIVASRGQELNVRLAWKGKEVSITRVA